MDYRTVASYRGGYALVYQPEVEKFLRAKSQRAKKRKLTFEPGQDGELCRVPMRLDRFETLMSEFFKEVARQ